ncbi:GPCR, PTH11-type [Biscogniauxia marginata]|nr:GPCR, PTH11-type [Biscogniauxia marginata]
MASTSQADPNTPQLSPAEMGAMLSAAAYAQPPIKPQGLAMVLVVIITVQATIATIVVGLRVYARLWVGRQSKTWGWEDVFAILGYIAFLSSSIFAIHAAYYGLGTQDIRLNDYLKVRCTEYLLYSQVLYGFSMPFIKASVVFTLLRVTREVLYRWLLYGMLFVASVMALVGILASLLYCRPTSAYWNPLLGKCGDFMVVVNIGYAWTAVGIITDWMCAILPYFVVRKLQMARRTKIVVMGILGLGALASTATVVRAPYLQYYLAQSDQLYWNGHIILWCLLESGIGLTAACLPALRLLARQYLQSRDGSNAQSKGYAYGGSRDQNLRNHDLAMDNLSRNGKATVTVGKWERLDDENSSTKHIIQQTSVSVETEILRNLKQHN